MGVEPADIDGILITHTHSDHINGIKTFIKKYNTKLYLTQLMYDDLIKEFMITNYCIITGDFKIKDMEIEVLKTSHDASDSNGYIVNNLQKSIVYITDTGYINSKYFKKLENREYYIMESNHDVELLMNGKYPYNIKQRILGDKGHLSNKDSSYYLSKFLGPNSKGVILAHLSEDNNTELLAKQTLFNTLKRYDKKTCVIIAKQNEETEMVEV